jgi:membrane fusion protein, multidrug efflux system
MTEESATTAATTERGQPSGFWKWGVVGLCVASAATAGMALSNRDGLIEWPDTKEPAIVAPPPPVAVAPILPPEAPPLDPASLVRGVVNPQNESTIASKLTARIVAMPYSEGQSFAQGALLARFDCSQIHAELNAAEAATSAYRKTYETNVELDQFEAVGKNEVAVSKANLGKAQAEAVAVSTQLADCEVHAPFAGKIVEQIAHPREIAASGQPLLKIQSGRDVEMELIVPSKWLTWLKPGAGFNFTIDETGNVIRGRVTRFGASVDPVSKTIRVTAMVASRSGLVLPGMSGTANFDDRRASPTVKAAPDAKAALASPAQQAVDGKPS